MSVASARPALVSFARIVALEDVALAKFGVGESLRVTGTCVHPGRRGFDPHHAFTTVARACARFPRFLPCMELTIAFISACHPELVHTGCHTTTRAPTARG